MAAPEAGAYAPQGQADGPPPYAPPPVYAVPAYPPGYPPMYAQPYPPYGFTFVAPNDGKTVKPTVAAIFWVFVLVRDLFFLVAVSIFWMESANFGFVPNFPFGLVDEPALLLAFAATGVGASAAAMVFDLMREKHLYGTVAGLLSAACCVTPGILFGLGVVGISLAAIALTFHLVSGPEFARNEARARAAKGLPAQ